MPAAPLLSVFIPACNAAATVREAVESALDNGFDDLEVLVVDDGSTDDTAAVVAAIRHPALRLIRQESNLGIGATRRRGMAALRGRHAALLDADDIAVPGRFARQVARLEAADGPAIIGGAIEHFGDAAGVVRFPLGDAEIRAGLLFHDLPIANPAACLNLAPLRTGAIAYPEAAGAEDYALWAQALTAGLAFENLPEVVTRMRRHAGSLTRRAGEGLVQQAQAARRQIAAHFFPAMGAAAREALVQALSVNIGGGQRWIDGACALAEAAALADGAPRADAGALRRLLAENFLRMLRHAWAHGLIDNDSLELMTETNAHFERWRMADAGALDRAIMAVVAGS